MIDEKKLCSARSGLIDTSGVRRAFELGARLKNPINLSIGQPNFPVPDSIKAAAIKAIESDANGYTLSGGDDRVVASVRAFLSDDVGWDADDEDLDVMITSGTSGALILAGWAMLDTGDELIVPDPYFVIYPALGPMCGATEVICDTYPDFRMTAERVEPLLNERTKFVIVNSPGNPTGVVLSDAEMEQLVQLCESRGVMLLSDEIYDLFTYSGGRDGRGRAPSAASHGRNLLLVRGFGKNYGCTGWRLGFAAGPRWLIAQMRKFQQYSFVCAPSMAQHAIPAAHQVDMSQWIEAYERKRDMVVDALSPRTDLEVPQGAFYAFPAVPQHLGLTGTQFTDQLLESNVIAIPGDVFSGRDTHFRISYATDDDTLARGLQAIVAAMG